ncbi:MULTISPECIES: hypothetical protein [Vibrio]|uniref:hypothetical protein n=1 Tax=Vibrio TaxID=662 RepID=UPI002075AEB7|nr:MULTISPECIES: hypothetical protein [Vibrio]USD33723.1 hypothetical protein J8Z27_06375 [Vibrio sp. SCSIO 43186]USD46794.1 hypothetical protein J4N38_06575 [Vibrio sp. SCSIO 43145]USD70847.1 hypothetical protein J4N41_06375 [Vibrio sp. SCSIO 43139]USD95759.1 hypothetical protein CTT30_06475 [Vibrio coralliilyticus]
MEIVVQRIFKRILLILAGSGLLTNAIYVYGLGYYQGYVEAFGFEYAFFAIDWSNAIVWAYYASRELGANLMVVMGRHPQALLVVLFFVFVFARIWAALSITPKSDNDKDIAPFRLKKFQRKARYIRLKRKHRLLFKYTSNVATWLFIKEQAVFAFLASYFFIFFLGLLPFFLSIWVFLPNIGSDHGRYVVNEILENKKGNLCKKLESGWNPCVSIKTKHVKPYDSSIESEEVTGLIILKNGSYVGVYTENGAITMTLPSNFYYKNQR